MRAGASKAQPPTRQSPGLWRRAVAVGALVSVAVAGALLWASTSGGPEQAQAGPAELFDATAGNVVLPVTAPLGYSFETTNSTSAQGVVDMRSVLLRPSRLDSQPTVTLCAHRPGLTDRCASTPTTVIRQVDGLEVSVTLRGPAAGSHLAFWSSAALTTDPRRSSLFSAQDSS